LLVLKKKTCDGHIIEQFQMSPGELLFFLKALNSCQKFERRAGLLVGHEESGHSSNYYAPLENSLLTSVKDMPHLVTLWLAGLDTDFNGVVKRQLIEEVIPERSAGTLLHDSNGV